MKARFFELFELASAALLGNEVLLANYAGERSEFVRFNQGKVRQPGNVTQHTLSLELIDGLRHASADFSVSESSGMENELRASIGELRETLRFLPEDPHLFYNQDVLSSNAEGVRDFPSGGDLTGEIVQVASGLDLVGLLASGEVSRGFASSLGQRNWFTRHTFNFDFSVYAQGDRAVKSRYAGQKWDAQEFGSIVEATRRDLVLLEAPAKTIEPGEYNVYLAPAALQEIVDLLGWGGFGIKSHRTRQTPLLRMLTEGATFSPLLSVLEDTAHGAGPGFQSSGFSKPDEVVLLERGQLRDTLVSPRSAKEYGVPTNGASDQESPASLSVSPGGVPMAEAMERLETGLFINNLHYLNYSDRTCGRITGMTRFATLWVENGRPLAAVNVMRFDESLFRIWGENLVDFTQERAFRLASDTYGGRSTASVRLPGALIRNFRLTL